VEDLGEKDIMSKPAVKRPEAGGVVPASEDDDIERLLLELERVSATVERTAAAAAREAAEQGPEIDRLLARIRTDLAKSDEWIRVSSAT
jgi:hypothetical protein